jgi:hypothetical protein
VWRPEDARHGTYLPDDEYQGDETMMLLVKAHTAPNARQPGVCVLDEDVQRIGLPGGECDGQLLSRRSASVEMSPGPHVPAPPFVLL